MNLEIIDQGIGNDGTSAWAVSGTVNSRVISLPLPVGVSGTVNIGNSAAITVSGTIHTVQMYGSVSISGHIYPILRSNFLLTTSSSGDITIVSPSGNNSIRVLQLYLTASANQTLSLKSGSGTTIMAGFYVAPRTPYVLDGLPNGYVCETTAGQSFIITQLAVPLAGIGGYVLFVLYPG